MGVTQNKEKLKIEYDGTLTIATGRSRKETQWKNREMLWSELVNRLSNTTRTGETYSEYKKSAKSVRDDIKDIGGFVGGTLKGGRRKTEAVVWRQLITLDADFIKGDLWTSVELMFDFAVLAYSTHSHSPKDQRLRLVIPLARPITPDEYQAISRRLAADIGIDFFDDTTYQPHRLMYWPSTAHDAEFLFEFQDEAWLNPDEVLDRYTDWRDPSYWPESSRVQQSRQRMADRQGDPYEKPGMVGAFNRTYSIYEAIETFLNDVYRQEDDGRYSYIPGSTSGGLVIYEDGKFAYSHHGTDPVGGQLVNSFDLVRLHKFGIRDEDAKEGTPVVRLPSNVAMTEFAAKDDKVKRQMGIERLEEAGHDFDVVDVQQMDNDWLSKLERHHRTGKILSTRNNALLVLENDGNLKGKIAYNEFSQRPVILDQLPWENASAGNLWSDEDEAALFHYLESLYEIDAPGKVRDALGVVMKRHRYHPVREYLEGLMWDGVERLDNLLIDYLGAEDSDYTRTVTRKAFTAAVKRIYHPGCKFDYMLTLIGPQGVGKSLILNKLGGDWFSDSLTSVQGKEAYEQLQGVWLIEMGELTATRKADNEAIKHFLTKREDIFRVAYGRQVSAFPRQCIFIGTTNDRTFLKDRTGNRRYWPVEVAEIERTKSIWKDLTEEEVSQIWAEAKVRYQDGEKLYLEGELEREAERRQELHSEENPLHGMIQEYLEKPLPEDWYDRDLGQRRVYMDSDFGETANTMKRERVCALEIWVELMNGDPKNMRPMDSRNINDILRNMPGWTSHKGSQLSFGKLYGRQRAFVREMEF